MNDIKKEEIIRLILDKIEEYDVIYIFGHARPDGDCYGSQFGLKECILATFPHKKVRVITEESDFLSFIGAPEKLDEDIIDALAIVVDTANQSRVSFQDFYRAQEIIKIDHHEFDENDHYGNINLELVDYPACCEIITEIIMNAKTRSNTKYKLSDFGAFCLYTGLVTDTGGFKYRGVTKNTFACAGFLLDHNVDLEEINDKLGSTTLNILQFKAYVLNNIQTHGKLIYCVLKQDVIQKYNITDEDASNMVNAMAMVKDYPIWALIIENKSKNIRLRIRSNGVYLVPLANKFEGGGHANAVGGKLNDWDDLNRFIYEASKLAEEN